MKFNVSECDVLYVWRALLWGYSAFRGAGSRCLLQVLKMVILFNSLLSSSNSYIKHFCFHKKYVQLRWKTWSCSFSGPPKGKRFLFLQENIFFYKSLTTCYSSPKFPVRKIPAHQLFPWPRGKGLLVLQLLAVGAAWAETWARGGRWAVAMFSFGKQGFVLARWEGTGFLGLSLQWHLAVE